MNTNRQRAIIVGALFITATVAASIGYEGILRPILDAPDYLVRISEYQTRVLIGLLLALTNSAAIVGIAVVLFPILGKDDKTLAVGYLAARIVECATFIVGLVSLLALMGLSDVTVQAGDLLSMTFLAPGAALLAAYDGAFWLAVTLILSLTALILNYGLYRARLVPRFLSIWGLISGALVFVQGVFDLFGANLAILSLSIAVQEMVFAVWLILKGFNVNSEEQL